MNLRVSLKTMNMRILTLILSAIALSTAVFAQSDDAPCASDVLHEELLENDEIYQRSFFNLERRIQELSASAHERNDEIYTIPVVVHVIHEGEPIGQGANISQEQILSSITALNEDFRKLPGTNGDGDGVDVGIEFCLAARDPDGNASTGISRVDGTVVANYADEGIQATGDSGADELDVKELSIWPREDYLNIWVVNEIEDNDAQSGIQGFAYFPVNNPVDGIVILHNAIGTVGNIKPNTALNRTLAHEVGHYLGLYHTFHTTTDCSAETNCTTQGDRVCDTPPTILSASCSNPACSGTQQVENYMDYTSESCRNMFSQGQKDRMRSTLLADRLTILSSMGCVSVNDYDAGITDISNPIGTSCSSTFTPQVQLTNYGSVTLTSVNIHYSVDNTNAQQIAWTGSLNSGESISVELPLVSASGGDHEFSAWTSSPNGNTDENSTNNERVNEFSISSGAGLELEISLDYFGSETTWEVQEDGAVVASGGPYINNNQGMIFNESICVSSGCYTLWFYDVYGDGMGFTTGSYTLYDGEGTVLVEGDGDFEEEISHDFCAEEPELGPAPTANFNASNSNGCAGLEVDFTDTSVDAPTSWSWSFPGGTPSSSSSQNPQNIVYNSPGNYSVTLVVGNSSGSDSHTITGLVEVTTGAFVTLTATDVSCFDLADGSISSSVSGNGPYEYDWSTGNSGTSISGRPAGNYTLTVTDAFGCITETSATIDEPSEMTVSITASAPSCVGLTDGSISAQVNGGAGGYLINWDNGDQGVSTNELAAGNYSVLVTDANGCISQASTTLDNPEAITVNLTDFDISCDAEPGSANVSPEGGTGNYTIDWSNGADANSVTDLAVGNYSITVTDDNGCSATESFEITQSESLNVAVSITEISCAGLTDGGAQVVVSGGTGTYTYDWNTGNTWTSISNQGPGNYTVTVIDDAGCEGEASFSLSDPEPLTLSVFKSDISCNGMQDGTASATGTGGSGDLAYLWNDALEGATIDNLAIGNYNVVCVDEHGCSETENVQIIEPSALSATGLIVTAETCSGNNGSAVVNAMGGTGNHHYLWSNGAQTAMVEGLTAGEYSVTTSDDNACVTTTYVTIPFDCIDAPSSTQLNETSCQATGLTLDDHVYCEAIEEATMYNWRFINAATGLFAEEFTLGANNSFLLSNVINLGYGMNAEVSVRVMGENEIWSDWGETCTIEMLPEIPLTAIDETDCSEGIFDSMDILDLQAISGATSYEWLFEANGETLTLTSYVNQLTIQPDEFFLAGTTYSVSVRTEVNGFWSDYGSICNLVFDAENSITSTDIQGVSMNLHPNPSAGENIFIEFGNLPQGADVIDIRVYDISGKLVENNTLSITTLHPRLDYRFERKLTPGVYSLHIHLLSKEYKEKLIIR